MTHLVAVGRPLPQGCEPAVQQFGVSGEVSRNFFTDFAAIHVNRKITVIPDVQGSPRVLVRQPAEPPCGADRGVWRGDRDALALRKQLWEAFHIASKV